MGASVGLAGSSLNIEECIRDTNLLYGALYEDGTLLAVFPQDDELGNARKACGSFKVFSVLVTRDLLRMDYKRSALGELVASFLLATPTRIIGDKHLFLEDRLEYLTRIFCEEVTRLAKLLEPSHHRAIIVPYMPIVSRMSRLSLVYPWLRRLYNAQLSDKGILSSLAKESIGIIEQLGLGARYKGLLVRLHDPVGCGLTSKSLFKGLSSTMTRGMEIAQIDLRGLLAPSRIASLVKAPRHPLLRDPLLLVRLDRARIATRLVSFEEHLLILSGISPSIGITKERKGIIRTAKLLSMGFKPSIVKDYQSPLAAKWLLASILTLHLPKPILAPRRRLMNEYEYTCRLIEEGFNTHEPILVDLRRIKAAYTYIEGHSVVDDIKANPNSITYKAIGSLIADLHRRGIVLWDANPSNFIVRDDEIYVVDLEQARDSTSYVEKAWDLAMAIYYSYIYNPRGIASRAARLVEGYLDNHGEKRIIVEASKLKYAAPFLTVIPFNVIEKVRRTLARLAGA